VDAKDFVGGLLLKESGQEEKQKTIQRVRVLQNEEWRMSSKGRDVDPIHCIQQSFDDCSYNFFAGLANHSLEL
jgi:hypothetical protein